MNAFLLLGCFLLAVTEYVLSSAHMVPDEGLSTNRVLVYNAMSQSLDRDPPSVLIEEMPKSVKKSKKAKKTKKNKFSVIKRPPPPANCIPMGGSCKSPGKVCCDFCAFCQCRLFRTVCYCRMGNPNC
ncbi:agouti signaling protein 1 [Anabas testudineus]|uniref:Agouti-signaling protein n=1 Tax=Anabas testudineus TaxID=64144 RepID=A0A7N6B1I2_ANATE|nr:agouti signaling protein 1 [Anabas testudineus]